MMNDNVIIHPLYVILHPVEQPHHLFSIVFEVMGEQLQDTLRFFDWVEVFPLEVLN